MRTVQNPEERRAEILAAATELFLTRGFDQTTVDDIVAHLGISKGLVYYYFKTKDDLIAAVTEHLAAEFAAPVVDIFRSDYLSVGEKLALSLLHWAGQANNLKGRFRSLIDSQSQLLSRFRDDVFRSIAPHLAALTNEGIAAGLIANPDAAHSLILVAIGSITCLTLGPETLGFDREGFLGSVADTLERSLQMPAGSITDCLRQSSDSRSTGQSKGA